MAGWQYVDVDDPVGSVPVAAPLRDDPSRHVLLVRTVDGVLHATATQCPHLRQPLSSGHVDDRVLECGHHGYRFRLDDGTCVGPGDPDPRLAGDLPVYEVREGPGGVAVHLT